MADTPGKDCPRCGHRLHRPVRIGTLHPHAGSPPRDLLVCGDCATPEEQEAHRQQEAGVAGYCVVCEQWAAPPEAVVVGLWASASGSGSRRYAHRSCARKRGLRIVSGENSHP